MITPTTPDRKRVAGLIIGSALVSALGIGALAYTATSAAFTGTTDNTTSRFEAATVTLTDDDFGGTPFDVTGILPGDTVSDCIEVTYTGSTTDLAGLRLYGSSTDLLGGALLADLDLQVRHGVAGATCAAPGALTTVYATGDLSSLGVDFSTGSAGFLPTATPQTVPYLFDVTLDAATPNTSQGDAVSATFTWEVRSN